MTAIARIKDPTDVNNCLEKYTTIRMMGDQYHNNTIDLLITGIDKRLKRNKELLNLIVENYGLRGGRWTTMTNTEARRLNGVLKSKTQETFVKKLNKHINHQLNDTHYGALFHRDEIKAMLDYLDSETK